MRLTEKRKGKNVIPLRYVVYGKDIPFWGIEYRNQTEKFLYGDAADKLAAYEDTGLTPEDILCIRATQRITPERLAEIVRAKFEKRLAILPCKVGDTLYEIDLPEYGVIICKVIYLDYYNGPFAHVPGGKMISTWSAGVEVIEGHGIGSSYAFESVDFGKTVFLTREEAEAALNNKIEKES